ncbi:hypothetical protein ACNHYB_07420 [Isoptericola jiangsuensis]|uniref:hypothetical protein n=1 Tax=Isoptericola jiangsuensis TaxID=548579 RepID=UPI003AAD3B84
MRNPFRRKTLLDRIGGAVGLGPGRAGTSARTGLVAVGAVVAVTAASAVVSAVRERRVEADHDDGA